MDPDAPSPPRPVRPPVVECAAEPGTSAQVNATSAAGASSVILPRADTGKDWAPGLSDEESEEDGGSFSDLESEGEGRHSPEGREHVEFVTTSAESPPDSPSLTVHEPRLPVQEEASRAQQAMLTALSMDTRAAAMFVVGAAGA